MISISFQEIENMKDSEIIYVSRDAIYIQILEYEQRFQIDKIYRQELSDLTQIICEILNYEKKKKLKKMRVEMTVLEIKKHFMPYNYYPKSSFVQYISYED